MAVKFRNSLLGFNKDDVLKYVYSAKDAQTRNEQKIKELEAAVKTITDELTETRTLLSASEKKASELQAQVDDFQSREAALTRLSESIGKLYLVAKTNAKTIISTAKENADLSKSVVDKNLNTAEITTADLSDIESELLSTTQRFSAEIESIKAKLSEAKVQIAANDITIEKSESVLENLIQNVDAEVNV